MPAHTFCRSIAHVYATAFTHFTLDYAAHTTFCSTVVFTYTHTPCVPATFAAVWLPRFARLLCGYRTHGLTRSARTFTTHVLPVLGLRSPLPVYPRLPAAPLPIAVAWFTVAVHHYRFYTRPCTHTVTFTPHCSTLPAMPRVPVAVHTHCRVAVLRSRLDATTTTFTSAWFRTPRSSACPHLPA